MYELLKKLTPKAFIKKNETTIRLLLSLFYRGNRFKCCVCEFEMSRFITSKKGDKLCPKCGSLSRTRRLWHGNGFLKVLNCISFNFFNAPISSTIKINMRNRIYKQSDKVSKTKF